MSDSVPDNVIHPSFESTDPKVLKRFFSKRNVAYWTAAVTAAGETPSWDRVQLYRQFIAVCNRQKLAGQAIRPTLATDTRVLHPVKGSLKRPRPSESESSGQGSAPSKPMKNPIEALYGASWGNDFVIENLDRPQPTQTQTPRPVTAPPAPRLPRKGRSPRPPKIEIPREEKAPGWDFYPVSFYGVTPRRYQNQQSDDAFEEPVTAVPKYTRSGTRIRSPKANTGVRTPKTAVRTPKANMGVRTPKLKRTPTLFRLADDLKTPKQLRNALASLFNE